MSAGTLASGSSGGRSGRFGRRGGSHSQDFEVNLTSIIDCFTVLIAFVLVSTSFVSIGLMDAGVSAGGSDATKVVQQPIRLIIRLRADHGIAVEGAGSHSGTVASQDELS